MTDLPPGWEWATLGEIASSVKNGIFVSRPGTEPNGVPILRISSVRTMQLKLDNVRYSEKNIDELSEQDAILLPGDLLFTRYSGSREYVGVCARVPEGAGTFTYPDKLIRARVPIINSKYLAAAFASPVVRPSVEAVLRTTAGQVGISGSTLKNIRIPIAPLAEQQRIVAALEENLSRLDSGKINITSASRRTEKFRNQIITAGCTGTLLGKKGIGAPLPTPVGLNDGSLPSIPSNWQWVRLHEIADVAGGMTKDAKRQGDPSFEKVFYLRVANVQRGYLDLSTVATIKAPREKIEQLALRPGDVLLNEGGDRDKLARGWVWESQLPLCIHQNHVFRARIRNDILDPKILAWHANGFGRVWAEANGKQSVNLASISLSKIRLLPVPIPPREEQSRIVSNIEACLNVVDRLRVSSLTIENRWKLLRQSLFVEAFSGRLVPQDPNDEPASVLLEGIRSQRAALPEPKKTRRTKNTSQETLL